LKTVFALVAFLVLLQNAFAVGETAQKKTVAIVHGTALYEEDCPNITECITGMLLDDFGKNNSLQVTDQELELYSKSYLNSMMNRLPKKRDEAVALEREITAGKLTESRRKLKLRMLEDVKIEIKNLEEIIEFTQKHYKELRAPAELFVGRWKIMNALYDRYKGRIAITKFGPVPTDAIERMIVEEEKAGMVKILDKENDLTFHRSFDKDANNGYYPQQEGETALKIPPWEQ